MEFLCSYSDSLVYGASRLRLIEFVLLKRQEPDLFGQLIFLGHFRNPVLRISSNLLNYSKRDHESIRGCSSDGRALA
jgi:hypothetical protein